MLEKREAGEKKRTRRNSAPSGSSAVACSECGTPAGKYQRSPACWVRASHMGQNVRGGSDATENRLTAVPRKFCPSLFIAETCTDPCAVL